MIFEEEGDQLISRPRFSPNTNHTTSLEENYRERQRAILCDNFQGFYELFSLLKTNRHFLLNLVSREKEEVPQSSAKNAQLREDSFSLEDSSDSCQESFLEQREQAL